MTSAAIYGCAGLALSNVEKAFFRDVKPWGFIIFARNIENPVQVTALTAEFRATVGWNAPVLIDQEGGRVARLRPPHWRSYPPGKRYGEIYDRDKSLGLEAAELGARLIADELLSIGVDVDCLPVLDVPVAGAHDVIGDRAYGTSPEKIAALAAAASKGLVAGGVLPVIKHVPGHGRAGVDSHNSLPIVDASHATLSETDFAPFRAFADAPLAMTAHVIYSSIDRAHPATTSVQVIDDVIRGEIGFTGCLMSDDLSMEALAGGLGERARASLDAGCDLILHCNGKMDEMRAIASEVPALEGAAFSRAKAALSGRKAAKPIDIEQAIDRFSTLIAP